MINETKIKEDLKPRGCNEYGRAYAFFDCTATKDEIESELSHIRDMTNTPSELELTLVEGVTNLKRDDQLAEVARQVHGDGMKYVLQASYPSKDNKTAADELGAIGNNMYAWRESQGDTTFTGRIVYKDGNDYVFRE